MASLASLNPFADLADDTKKNKGKKQQSMHEMNNNKNNINNNYNNTNNINNNPFGLGLGNDDTFGNVTTNNANKNMHIDHLADFDPLASPPKKAENNNNNNFNNNNTTTTTTTVSSANTTTNDNNNYELEKTYSCEDDLQKLSMLVHRGTLNEAEKMVAREMVMDRTPGISFAISSAICKNKQELLKLIAMHQGGHFHGNDDPNTSNKWNSNSDDGALNIFEENNFDSGFFETSNKDSSKKKGTNDFNNTTSSFDHAKWENENQGVDQDNWFKTTTSGDDRNTTTTTTNKTDRSSSSHANYIQSPTHNIKRVDPQSLSQRHIDYDKFKTTSQGALVGMCMQRVTSKKILRKWSPRYFVLTKNALCLYKEVWEYTKGKPPKLQVPLHRLMLISDVYVFTKEDALQGPRRAYQFKILENKLSEHFSTMHYQQFSRTLPSVEVCKLGHVDQKAATLLRTELVKAVLEKQNNAGASVGKQVVSGRYE